MSDEPTTRKTKDSIGPYRLIEELGRGGQGAVYLAEDTRLRRRVALKIIDAVGPVPESRVTRFRREAGAASKLDHPNICTIHEAGEVDGVPFIAMRYVEGETLAQAIGKRKLYGDSSQTDSAIDPTTREGVFRIIALIATVARALHHAHEQGLIHRDIKPGNIMVTKDGEPIVLDFGLARDELADEHTLTHSGDLLGTPAYMSPEQLVAQRIPLDRRTDVYSLGATLYECLTLEPPFAAATRAELYQKIINGDPSIATSENKQIPKDLQVAVDTALDRNRDRRYQTALDLAEDLRRVREFEPIRARPIGRLLRARRWAQRHPALATAVGVLTLGLTASLIMLVQRDAALRQAEHNQRVAQDALAAAFLEKADRAIDDGDHGAAAIFAAAALWHDPNNPNGPHYRRPSDRDSKVAEERIALMHSRHYEAEAGRRLTYLRTLRPPTPLQSSGEYAISPTRREIAVGTLEGAVCLFDLDRDVPPVVLKGRRPGISHLVLQLDAHGDLRYAPGGTLLAQIVEDAVQLWDTRTRALVHEIEIGEQPSAMVFLSDDELALGDRAGTVRIYSLVNSSSDAQRQFPARILALGHSPKDGRIAVAALNENVWLVATDLTGDTTLPIPKHASDFAFSPDGESLAMAVADDAVWRFSLADGERLDRRAMRFRPGSVHYSPDGKRIAYGGALGAAFLYDPVGASVLDCLRGPARASQFVRFAPDGKTLASSGVHTDVRLWQVAEPGLRERRAGHQGPFVKFTLSPDGQTIVTASHNDGMILRWTRKEGRGLDSATVSVLREAAAGGPKPLSITMSSNGRWLATSSVDGQVELHSLLNGDVTVVRRPGEARYDSWESCFDPEGRVLYIPEGGGRILRWDVAGGRFLDPPLSFGRAHVNVVTMSSDGDLIASGSADGTVRIGRPVPGAAPSVLGGHEGLVSGLAFSPDDTELASSGIDAEIRVWSVATGTLLEQLVGHEVWVNSIEYSPDGKLLLSASDDNTVRLWHLPTSRVLQVFRCAEHAVRATFTPDGRSFYMNDGRYLTRYDVTVNERIDDPGELLRRAERAAGMRLEGLELVPLK